MQEIAIIIPCYNEAERLPRHELLQVAEENNQVHLYLVDDGSTDTTASILKQLSKHPRIDWLPLPENGGKAEAVRQGMLHVSSTTNYELLAFLDADLATPPEELLAFTKLFAERPALKIVFGSRWKRLGSEIERSLLRHYLGRIFATVVSVIFGLSVYDTQCGAKMMRKEGLQDIFAKPFLSPWFFDIEILCRYRHKYPDQSIDLWAAEIPLQKWREIGGSRVKLWDFIKAPLALWKIKRHYQNYRF